MSIDHDEISKLVERMPAFPQGVTKVLELASKPNCAPKDLVKVIEHDPVMTMKVLKLVNSAYFGLSRPINSINHGVVYVGINTIKNLALSIAAIGMLPKANDAGFDMNQFLMHSLGVAGIAKLLAERLQVPDKDATDYFVAGLLHDFGKVVLAQYKPAEFQQALQRAREEQIPLHQVEQAIYGISHAEIGGALAEVWKLPGNLVDCIRYHHQLDASIEDSRIRDAVFAANQVVRSLPLGDSGNPCVEEFPASIHARFGQGLDRLIDDLGDLHEQIEKARSFAQV